MEQKYDVTVSSSREESLLKALEVFEQEQKQQSSKEIIRPDINTNRILGRSLLCFGILLFGGIMIYVLHHLVNTPVWLGWVILCSVFVFMIVVNAKKICCECILLYQRYAPQRVRSACVFQPTCSVYMLQAIDKYGVVKGVIKGVRRLFRCHYPNGGEDLP